MSSITQSSTSSGMAGLKVRPAWQPWALMAWMLRCTYAGCVGVKADQVGTGLGKGLGQRVHGLHHQVHVDRHGPARRRDCMGLERLADHGAEGQVGHIQWLSITSKWIQSAPAAMTFFTSSPRRAKSADRMEGAMR